MKKYKNWFIGTISVSLAVLILIACAVAAADPFFHYHKPFENFSYDLNASDQIYINPGILRHFDYDAVITGSSMTENFRTTYFYEILGANAVKVPVSGASAKDVSIILETALKNNEDLKTVYLCIDVAMLRKKDTSVTKNPLPLYLYNSNLFDDTDYLLNKDVLFNRIVPALIRTSQGIAPVSFDEYSFWADLVVFSQQSTLKSVEGIEKGKSSSVHEAAAAADKNLKANIIPLLEAYPDVKFVIFFPPRSILYWYITDPASDLAILELAAQTFLSYDNTEVFMFMNDASIITNLYNYKDYSHYSADINAYMTECFRDGTHRLTNENLGSELQKMRDIAENFDYGIVFGESNPFIAENNFLRYTDKLNDSRYIVLTASRSDSPAGAADIFAGIYSDFGLDAEKRGRSYAAVFSGGNAVFEQAGEDRILYSGDAFGLSVSIVCEDRGGESYAEIVIDGVRYAYGQREVIIVVYDTVTKRVLDNIYLNMSDGSIRRR